MMTIFRRELRENLKWAGVICVLLLFIFIHETRNASSGLLFLVAQRYTLILAPLAGLWMGVVQALFEMRADNWAFVVHRPVARGAIFAAKCGAGLLLLMAALSIPCAYVAIWAARPGNQAMPFQGRMGLPMAADVLSASCYYFGGLVLMLRRARWHGSRLLPLGLAVALSGANGMFVQAFWQAGVAILAVSALGAVAAWGAFATHGTMEGKAMSRLALGVMIYPGALMVTFFLMGLVTSFDSGGAWQYYQVDRNGDLVRVTLRMEGDQRSWEFADVNGRPREGYANVDLDDVANANLFLRFNAVLFDPRAAPAHLFKSLGYRSLGPGVTTLRAGAPTGVRLRFTAQYVAPERLIELFDPVSNSLIGAVGPGGFTPGAALPAERFPGVPLDLGSVGGRHVLAYESGAYWMELDQRRVRVLFNAAAEDPIVSVAEIGPVGDPWVILATRQTMHVLKPNGEQVCAMPVAQDWGKEYAQPALNGSNHHVLVQVRPYPTDKTQARLLEYSADGTLVRQTPLPPEPSPRAAKFRETVVFGALFPAAAYPIVPAWVLDDVVDIRSEMYASTFAACMLTTGVLGGLVVALLARRFGLTPGVAIGWVAVAMLLGPAGVLLFLSLRSLPARERCAACGRKRFIGPGACPYCQAVAGAREASGVEIFEPTDVFQTAVSG